MLVHCSYLVLLYGTTVIVHVSCQKFTFNIIMQFFCGLSTWAPQMPLLVQWLIPRQATLTNRFCCITLLNCYSAYLTLLRTSRKRMFGQCSRKTAGFMAQQNVVITLVLNTLNNSFIIVAKILFDKHKLDGMEGSNERSNYSGCRWLCPLLPRSSADTDRFPK